ncbi:hypothetical protein PUN28_005899 [Cardiocondyla obscurior]|uniref:Uncharacterized protein n=1 Tax=Cardiocondyla obscurior TaxID=286306 RepID=A0AAW2G6R4_9HYME
MLKYAILVAVFCTVQSQRPWHAGTGGRLPQVLPQYIDERIAAEQAAQATPGNQGTQGMPINQGTQGMPINQGAQEIPVRQGGSAQGIPVQGFQPQGFPTQGFPMQGSPCVPTYQGSQGTPTYQGSQGMPTYQGSQGTLTYQGSQGMPTYQGSQGMPTYQGSQGNPTTGSAVLGNRIDSGDSSFTVGTASTQSTINPADLPVDAHGDIDLINRIKTWPRDKQPFWYINWQAIQAHRGDANNTAQPSQTQPNTRSFFAG